MNIICINCNKLYAYIMKRWKDWSVVGPGKKRIILCLKLDENENSWNINK